MPSVVPNFVVAGAAKSGTTSLAHYLRQHPDVFVAREKECHYLAFPDTPPRFTGPGDDTEFNRIVITDRDRYLRCFDGARDERAVGEASVFYLYRPDSLRMALTLEPGMRFIVVLREPIDRAYSAYSHHVRDQRETAPTFSAALAQEDQRIIDGWGYGWHYRHVGDYVTQLAELRSIVPADQVHVLLYDYLAADPISAMQDVYRFLGVDPTFVPDASIVLNASGAPRLSALNRLLTRDNGIKTAVKRVIPYELGLRLSHRVRNWNLRRDNGLTPDERRAVEPLFDLDHDRLAELSGCDLSPWRVPVHDQLS